MEMVMASGGKTTQGSGFKSKTKFGKFYDSSLEDLTDGLTLFTEIVNLPVDAIC